MQRKIMLKLEKVCFSYDKREILKDINFRVYENEIISILGANGSGKSTLLKIIMGFLNYSGNIFLNNHDIKKLSIKQRAKNIAYVPQNSNIIFDFSSFEVVLMGRYHHNLFYANYTHEDKKIANKALEMLNITKLKNRAFKTLSGGEKQLVLIARAITQQSKIIILDEPVTGLDLKNQVKLLENIQNLSKNCTILQTTHSPSDALKVSDFIIWLEDKKIAFKGRANEVINEENIKKIYDIQSQIIKAKNNKKYLITL